MGDNRTDLPEGTDTIIAGASDGGELSTENELLTDTQVPATRDTGSTDLRKRLRDGGERLSDEAGDRARGFVSQGLSDPPRPFPTSASWSAIPPMASMSV
ncbi:hypothetical protein H9L15_10865 [Sphingomonas daechungensis]|uniref:Uncharacterized protein n=1 Tax=Sphingomonas daechungensis TaxID=1176646 RepID=A0ABX6T165_9SPHN|nr:hypothetical protein [Sphingomonas daechungensis]QNP42657.1 hypothetical protein H9L15_10865 [Sphingomonas daechungensis]